MSIHHNYWLWDIAHIQCPPDLHGWMIVSSASEATLKHMIVRADIDVSITKQITTKTCILIMLYIKDRLLY